MLLSFDPLQDGPGLELVDHVEGRQCLLRTPTPVELSEVSSDEFYFPVDRGVSFEAESIVLPHRMAVLVRNSLGFQVQELTKGESQVLPTDRYTIDLTAPVKLYLVVEAPLAVDVTADEVRLDFGAPTEVLLGARSYHKKPAATITTTADPMDVMAAVSALGSALKTTSPERSYPTLRGHPPTIELGDELHIPATLERPDTGVTIEVPAELRHIFVVSPLAYYLGAEVTWGPAPRLVTDTGFEHDLDDPARGFEGEVERVLKQVFFLDCLTRTEGFYPVDLHERNAVEASLDLDFEALYEASLSEQLEAYLQVPYAVIEPELPEWKLTAHVTMTPQNVEVLPFIINDLAVVRSPSRVGVGAAAVSTVTEEFVRSPGDFTRSSATDARSTAESAPTPAIVRPEQADSLEQAWVGEGAPVGASKAMIEAYRNRLERTPTDGDIDITVICNDAAMNDERDIVDDIYGSREELPFDVLVHRELTVDELRAVLEEDCNFLHYIGHIDERGFECVDGFLDAATLEHTGVEAFLLNACTSYQQGMELIRAGSIAGVVTVEDVINSGAERIGSTLAKLLNYGFPFSAALTIAKDESIVGGQYLVLGDGGIDIAQPDSSVPAVGELSIDDTNLLSYYTYPSYEMVLGSLTIPYAGDNSEYFLVGGECGRFELTDAELRAFCEIQTQPIKYNGKLYWTDDDEMRDLFNLAD